MLIKRKEFFSPDEIFEKAAEKINQIRKVGEEIDYLTFVPDGEPTLDLNLGKEIDLLKPLGIKIAVITNSSLIWDNEVRKDLLKADLVSIKVDSVLENTWRKVDRPHRSLDLNKILAGIVSFKNIFKGTLITETMLVKDINDSTNNLNKTSDFLSTIKPNVAYLSIPTRPPSVSSIMPPTEDKLNYAYNTYTNKSLNAELIIGYEGNAFASSGNATNDLLSITSVHPMRIDAVRELLKKTNSDWSIIQNLLDSNMLKEVLYSNNKFFVRIFNPKKK